MESRLPTKLPETKRNEIRRTNKLLVRCQLPTFTRICLGLALAKVLRQVLAQHTRLISNGVVKKNSAIHSHVAPSMMGGLGAAVYLRRFILFSIGDHSKPWRAIRLNVDYFNATLYADMSSFN